MNKAICTLLILCGFLSTIPCIAQPKVVDTMFPTDDIVVATVVVDGPRDGLSDASASIQSAIDQVSDEGGGVVFLPAGRYRLDGRLVVNQGVTLRGDWAPPTTKGWQRGTVLMPTVDRGNVDAPARIRLTNDSGVRNLAIWYADQNPRNPIAYPWTIGTSTALPWSLTTKRNQNASQTVLNVTLVNSYKGITIGPECNFLHVIRNVYGTPLKVGLSIDTCVDVGRTQNVDFRPEWWETSGLPDAPTSAPDRAALRDTLIHKATSIDIGRDEWGYLYDLRVRGYATGMIFRTGYGDTNGMVFGSQFLDCGTAIRLDDVCQFGIGFTGCRFSGRDYAVYASAPYTGVVQFNSCRFDSQGRNAVHSDGSGALTFQNCDIMTWRNAAAEITNGTVSIVGCKFGASGSHVMLGKSVQRAIILGSTFVGKPLIVSQGRQTDLQVAYSPLHFAKPDTSLMPPAPNRLPATRRLFVVNDFGASPTLDDNTQAFSRSFEAAKKAGGGTVYVPAGAYHFKGTITVPTGVELRGCFDIPHHTVVAGSALLPTTGKGDPDGTPFIRLQPGSGLRGLTIWYPDQDPQNIVAYPWAVQSLGPRCWVINLNCGNAYNGVDFWTYPSDGHVVKYLSGAYYNKGLFVSKCKGDGWVDDVHYNPHYSGWVDSSLSPTVLHEWDQVMNYVRSNLEGIVFGRCEREHIKGTFLYASRDGLAFKDDHGGANARVIHHGTDNGARCVAVEASGKKGIEFIGLQLTPSSPIVKAGIATSGSFTGKASFFNSIMFTDWPAADIAGSGDVLIQQLNNVSGAITLRGGRCALENTICKLYRDPQVRVEAGCKSARLIGNISPFGDLQVENRIGDRCSGKANSLTILPASFEGAPSFRTGWEDGEAQGIPGTTKPETMVQVAVSKAACGMTDADAHSGRQSLRIAGSASDPQHAYVYFNALSGPIAVYPDTVLSYWMKPLTPTSIHTGIDLTFSDGSSMRESTAKATTGEGLHPSNPKGQVGAWKQIIIPLGRYFQGKTISTIMFAYDDGPCNGAFETLFDDVAIESKLWDMPEHVVATPSAGVLPVGARIELNAEGSCKVRYTLNGTVPGPNSPLYTKPIVLNEPGLYDLRYVVQAPDGRLGFRIFAQLYDVVGPR